MNAYKIKTILGVWYVLSDTATNAQKFFEKTLTDAKKEVLKNNETRIISAIIEEMKLLSNNTHNLLIDDSVIDKKKEG